MFQSRMSVIGVSIAALLIGLALGSRFRSAPTEPPSAAAGPSSTAATHETDRIAELTRELDRERGLRGALEIELSLLRREMEPDPAPPSAPTAASSPTEGSGAVSEASNKGAKTPDEKSAHAEWFDASKLTELGMDERRAEWLRERFEALQMEELYLSDQARRDQSLHKPRYGRELLELREDTRAEIGDEDYDSMLYASGRHNRVLLSNVLQNSPAAAAGVQAGDVLVRYGDQAIYDVRDLLAATAGGELGESTSIDIERDGERLRLFVERGPLGARIQPLLRAPPAGH
jgi:hypothetical protein